MDRIPSPEDDLSVTYVCPNSVDGDTDIHMLFFYQDIVVKGRVVNDLLGGGCSMNE